MQRRIIPGIVNAQNVIALAQTQSVHDAVQSMHAYNIAAIAVTDADDTLIGIVSERDITHRVLACGLNPQATPLSDVMTHNPETLRANDAALDAVELMLGRGIRHLPVIDADGRMVAMVSMRDLLKATLEELNTQVDQAREAAFAPEG